MNTHTAIIAFGSNLANPIQHIQQAAQCLTQLPQIQQLTLSPLYRTAPVGYTEQPDFINAVACVQTSATADELLRLLQDMEQQFGRVRTFQNAPRTLDLDVIDFNHEVVETEHLILPHPRAHLRAFVMRPLADIAPDYRIGTYGTAQELAKQLGNEGIVKLTSHHDI